MLVSLSGSNGKGAFWTFVRAFSVLPKTGGAALSCARTYGWGPGVADGSWGPKVLHEGGCPLPIQLPPAPQGFHMGSQDPTLWHSFNIHWISQECNYHVNQGMFVLCFLWNFTHKLLTTLEKSGQPSQRHSDEASLHYNIPKSVCICSSHINGNCICMYTYIYV